MNEIDEQYRKHDTDCDRTVASLVCSDCETMLWADNERLAKLEEINKWYVKYAKTNANIVTKNINA